MNNVMDKIQRCVKAAEQNEISPEKAVETIDELSEQLENTKRKVCMINVTIYINNVIAQKILDGRKCSCETSQGTS